jgi:predicted regulator of Ras-like GTPase activity (Roadblock/LC7/MglB family)
VDEVVAILNRLLEVREVKVAVVVGEDGLVLESAGAEEADVEEIGAICSNGYLSFKRIGEELNYGAVVQSVTRYQSGVIVLSRLPNQLTLAVVATEKANLAKVWDATGGIITEMARLLR